MATTFTIIGIGEALYDCFPDEQRLGGAPLNVAVHAHQLAAPHDGRGVVVSRIGQDALGERALATLRERGMTTEFIESDPDRPTGQVTVTFSRDGEPHYAIADNVAWDWIHFDPDLETLARRCDGLAFGTLALRHAESRNAILRFVEVARQAIRLYDVNLRPGQDNRQTIAKAAELASVIKLNEHELPQLADMFNVDAEPEALLAFFALDTLVLTRGKRGTVLITATQQVEGSPVSYPMAEDADSVGAGDACAAGILVGLTRRLPLQDVADLANKCGAYVASQPGATPVIPVEITG